MACYSCSPGRVNCLLDTERVFDATEWNGYMAVFPGQKYDVNEQCQQVYNDESYYCGVSYCNAYKCAVFIVQNLAHSMSF